MKNWTVESFKKGDIKTIEAVYKKYYRLLVFVAKGVLNNNEDSEDVAQEAFEKAIEKRESYNYDKSFPSWLCQITRNLSIDKLRARKVSTLPLDNGNQSAADPSISPKTKADGNILLDLLKQILSKEDYEIYMLRVYFDLSFAEIGSIESASAGAIKKRFYRLEKKIKVKLTAAEKGGLIK